MGNPKKYATYEDFERDEYMRVKTFYENLEDIMEEDLFSHFDDNYAQESQGGQDTVRELEF